MESKILTIIFSQFQNSSRNFKVSESRYKQRGVTSHFSTGQTILKKYWENINDTINWEIYWKNIEKRSILTQSINKSFLIDTLTTNNAIYRYSLTLTDPSMTMLSLGKLHRDSVSSKGDYIVKTGRE